MKKDKNTEYKPPRDMWEVNSHLDFNAPLDIDDPRYVDTVEGRGHFSFKELYTTLGVDPKKLVLRSPKVKSYNVFCGHRGCGKTTELKRLSKNLHNDKCFFVMHLDSVVELDPHNLRYPDILLGLANKLLGQLEEENIAVDSVLLKNLSNWFSEKIINNAKLKDFSLEVETTAEASVSIPFLAKLSAKLMSKIKSGATYKEEIRHVVTNYFSEFAFAFNQLNQAVEDVLEKSGKSGKLMFIIDGTDRLNDEDSRRLFIKDVNQLQEIESNFLYCCPIHLLYEGNQIHQVFTHFLLPMIKISQKDSVSRYEEGYEVLRKIVYRRVDKDLFESEEIVDMLIENSGGSPRELLKLLKYALVDSDMEHFAVENARKAIHNLSMDYRMFLNTDDYKVLYDMDHGNSADENSEQIRHLLYNLAILQYNNYWRRSHPIVRHLSGYTKYIRDSRLF